MNDNRIGRAPDYTQAALTMLGVNLMWIFFVIWAVWGLGPVLVLAALINHGISRLKDARG
ncbi:MAG: hypothetical protein AAGA05_07220 [Pseudomonadota bacterium]